MPGSGSGPKCFQALGSESNALGSESNALGSEFAFGFALRVHLAQLAQCIPTVCRACAERACADLQDLQ